MIALAWDGTLFTIILNTGGYNSTDGKKKNLTEVLPGSHAMFHHCFVNHSAFKTFSDSFFP